MIRIKESEDTPVTQRQPDSFIKEIEDRERFYVTNEMTVVGALKPGLVRRIFLFITLKAVIPIRFLNYIPTVSTARWLQIDDGKRLVFIAYYTNTSEGYARDFVDSKQRSQNMNAIFSHGIGFPHTRWVIKDGGGKDPRGYMNTVRGNQHITQVWYAPYPKLSVDNIVMNRKIRQGLHGSLNGEELDAWLRLF